MLQINYARHHVEVIDSHNVSMHTLIYRLFDRPLIRQFDDGHRWGGIQKKSKNFLLSLVNKNAHSVECVVPTQANAECFFFGCFCMMKASEFRNVIYV